MKTRQQRRFTATLSPRDRRILACRHMAETDAWESITQIVTSFSRYCADDAGMFEKMKRDGEVEHKLGRGDFSFWRISDRGRDVAELVTDADSGDRSRGLDHHALDKAMANVPFTPHFKDIEDYA